MKSVLVAPMLHQNPNLQIVRPKVTTAKIVIRSRANKDGEHALQLRITKDKRSIRINVGKSILKKDWDEASKKAKTAYPNSKWLNNFLDQKRIEARKQILELESRYPDLTLEMIKNRLVGSKNHSTVFTMADEYFENLLLAQKFNRYSGERAAINHLKRYRKNEDLAFEDMTVSFLEGFKAYLLGFVGISERSSINYLITIRTIFNRAIKNGVVNTVHYPFGKGKISCKRPESEKIGLEKSEVQIIESIQLDKTSFVHHARNIWLFSFYFAGMRASDVLTLRWGNFKAGRLYYTMGKNLKSDSTIIPKKAERILEEYKNEHTERTDLVFPDLNHIEDFNDKITVQKKLKYRIRKLDKALKKIAELIDLEKDLTMHIARHTFGNIAGDKIPIQKLQQLYRHSSVLTTINYQKAFLYKGSDEALEKVLDF